jgi:hypothetical protein
MIILQVLSLGPLNLPMLCGISSKLLLSTKENKYIIQSNLSKHAWKYMNKIKLQNYNKSGITDNVFKSSQIWLKGHLLGSI